MLAVSRNGGGRRRVEDGPENLQTVRRGMIGFEGAVGMGHHAEDISALVPDSCDIFYRAVRVGVRSLSPFRITITQKNLPVCFKRRQPLLVDTEVSFAVPDGQPYA